MRLIDADELIRNKSMFTWYDIKNAPTIDAVEVVRCKECDNRFYDKDRNLYYCTMYYGMGDVHDENYCSFGERREDD